MGHQGHTSRQNAPKVKRARVHEAPVPTPARRSHGYDDTGRAPHATQQFRAQQHQQSRVPQEQIATTPTSAPNSEYGSQPSDGTHMQDVDVISEASIGSGDQDAGLAVAVSAMSSHLEEFCGHLQTNNALLQKLVDEMTICNKHNGELRAATRTNTSTVKMMMDWFKVHYMPHVSPVPNYDGTGSATFTHRNLPQGPPGPPDQGGTGQFPPNGFIQ